MNLLGEYPEGFCKHRSTTDQIFALKDNTGNRGRGKRNKLETHGQRRMEINIKITTRDGKNYEFERVNDFTYMAVLVEKNGFERYEIQAKFAKRDKKISLLNRNTCQEKQS